MDRVQLITKKLEPPKFFPSGSTLLDLALGGGWAQKRVFNIVGDKSVGKTLNAIEAFANFKQLFQVCKMRYAEAESAFDEYFADQLGYPPEVTRPDSPLETIEDFRDDVSDFIKDNKEEPSLYILDSLDALSDSAELEKYAEDTAARKKAEAQGKEFEAKGTYGATKAKEMSKFFRMLTSDIEKSSCTLGIISQVRDNIGVMFGETKTRSGGKALDFYASQVLWLAHTGIIERTANNQKRATGISVLGKVKKNKVGLPFRTAEYDIIFGYGIDDEMSILDWLKEVKAMPDAAYKNIKDNLIDARKKKQFDFIKTTHEQLKADATNIWKEIEKSLEPPIRKYGNVIPPPPIEVVKG